MKTLLYALSAVALILAIAGSASIASAPHGGEAPASAPEQEMMPEQTTMSVPHEDEIEGFSFPEIPVVTGSDSTD